MGRGSAAKRVSFIVERGISFVLCASLCAGLTKIVSSPRWGCNLGATCGIILHQVFVAYSGFAKNLMPKIFQK